MSHSARLHETLKQLVKSGECLVFVQLAMCDMRHGARVGTQAGPASRDGDTDLVTCDERDRGNNV